jgi:hypothetical protein
MPVYKGIGPKDIKTAKSFLNQLVDVVQSSVSQSVTRKAYEVFISGSGASSITSSLFQTVFDQDFTLATANEMFDMTMGLYASSSIVTESPGYGVDTAGKLTFSSNTAMMREKVQVYNQFAQVLLGNANSQFSSPFSSANPTDSDKIDAALFLPIKRLFFRDGIKPETFAMKVFASATLDGSANASAYEKTILNGLTSSNVGYPGASGSFIITDAGAGSVPQYSYGGKVSNLINSADTSQNVGLIFYDQGIVILDMEKVFFADQHMSGVISAATASDTFGGVTTPAGTTFVGRDIWASVENPSASFVPDFVVSSSMDDIINHVASVRFGNSSNSNDTAITFQNLTTINSTLVFCEAAADEFNYSSNPTFTDDDGRIVVIDEGSETTQKSFTFITTIGLYDAADNLLAVAKLSRPVEKNDEKKLSFRVRLDY